MASTPPGAPRSMISHVSLGTNDLDRAVAFYDRVLATLGVRRVMAVPGGMLWGIDFPEFSVNLALDGRPATVGNGSHVAFLATSRFVVDAFHREALAAGGTDEGAPGYRLEYEPGYYAAFVRDPDGHKLEATFIDPAAAS